jgi:hypothetical protein
MMFPKCFVRLAAVALLSGPAAAETLCDQGLKEDAKSPLSYQMRGDRCEGIYAQQVSSISLEVRSLVAGFKFDPARDTELALAWTAPPGVPGNVRLRVFSFKPLTYYRMDTAIPVARGTYRWPTNILASEKLGRADLGLVAWLNVSGAEGTTRTVHLPLHAGPDAAGKKAHAGYEISLLPSVRLNEVRVTVKRLDSQGVEVATLRLDEELGYGYYPSNTPTVFSTGTLGPAGFYRVRITAVPKSGLSTEQEIDLYHPGD